MSRARSLVRPLVAGIFSMALLVLVAVLGQVPYGRASDHAVLRLSLRTVQGQIEICRDRTEAELAALPQHMRTPTECVDHTPRYRLTVTLDGRGVIDRVVAPGGIRGDRPLIVDERIPVEPGRAALTVRFVAEADATLAADQQAALARLPKYELARQTTFSAGRVTLVTLDDGDGELRLVNR